MWHKVIATFESGKQITYEKENLVEALKIVERLKATSEVVYCKYKMVKYSIKPGEGVSVLSTAIVKRA